MSKVLVTGAGGYVGGRLVRALEAGDQDVHALVREPTPWLDVSETVCDLCTVEPELLAGACRDVDVIVHLAGENEVVAVREPAGALSSTVVATERLAEAACAAGVRRLVYLSTVHVYGARIEPGVTLTEDLRPEPRSAYAISRLACEHVAARLAAGGYELVILRLTNSVGAPLDARVDRWSLVANDLARQGARNGRLSLRSSGVQWRDFVGLGDVCAAILAACRRPAGARHLQPRIGDGDDRADARSPHAGRVRAANRSAPAAAGAGSPARAAGRLPRVGAADRGAERDPIELAAGRRRGDCGLLPGASRGAVVSEIHGLRVTPLRRIPDERGAIMHMLRRDDPGFEQFGEIYFSLVYPGVVKGWHVHSRMTLNYAVPVGMVKLVCYDERSDSPTQGAVQEIHLGELNYVLVTIPPRVWNGFKGEGTAAALIANCATEPHDPGELERLDPFAERIPYDWALRHG